MKISELKWVVHFEPTNLPSPDDCDDCYVKTSNGFHIAKVYNPDAQFEQHGELPIANLIAAAPEMLEALELIVWKLKDESEKYQTYFNWHELSDLINKAKGL